VAPVVEEAVRQEVTLYLPGQFLENPAVLGTVPLAVCVGPVPPPRRLPDSNVKRTVVTLEVSIAELVIYNSSGHPYALLEIVKNPARTAFLFHV